MGKELSAAILRKHEIQAEQELKLANAIHNEIKSTARHLTLKAVEAGRILLRIKGNLGHGNFLKWFESADTHISERTANNYMLLAANWEAISQAHGEQASALSIDAAVKCVSQLKKENRNPPKRVTGKSAEAADLSPVPCPHGGEHEYDDEACIKCHDPRPAGADQAAVSEEPIADAEELSAGPDCSDAEGADQEPPSVAPQLAEDLFREAERCLTDLYRQLTKLSVRHPSSRYSESCLDSLDVASQDLRKWKKEVCK